MRTLLGVLLAVATAASCSSGDAQATRVGAREVTLRQASSTEFLRAHAAVAFLSTGLFNSSGSQRARVVFVARDGTMSFLKTPALDNGLIAANARGDVAFSSSTTDYVLGRERPVVVRRGGTQDTGHWSGSFARNNFVRVFNTGAVEQGGYATDIYWNNGAARSHARMRDVPGAVGLDGDVLLSTNSGSSTLDGTVSLYTTPLRPGGRTSKAFEWSYAGAKEGAYWNEGSDIFAARGRAWFLETIQPPDDHPTFTDGAAEHVRLAELDVDRGTYRSTPLLTYRYAMTDCDDEFVPLAGSAARGHLFEDRLYTVDCHGRLIAVDLATRTARTAGRIDTDVLTSPHALAAWRGSDLTILYTDETAAGAALATYDLTSGKETSNVPVRGLREVIGDGDDALTPWSLASLP